MSAPTSGADFATYENARIAVLILRAERGAAPPVKARWLAGALELTFDARSVRRTQVVFLDRRFRTLWQEHVPVVLFEGAGAIAGGAPISRDQVIAVPLE